MEEDIEIKKTSVVVIKLRVDSRSKKIWPTYSGTMLILMQSLTTEKVEHGLITRCGVISENYHVLASIN